MAVRPPGGPAQSAPINEDPQATAQSLKNLIIKFVDIISEMQKNPHLAESSKLDALATTIENLHATAQKAARGA